MINFAGPESWPLPLATMALCWTVGWAWVVLFLRRQPALDGTFARRQDLEAHIASLVDTLREMDEQTGASGAKRRPAERQALEEEAADCLKELRWLKQDARDVAAQAKASAIPPRPTSQWVGAMWGAGATALAAFLFIKVQQDSAQVAPPPRATQADARGADIPADVYQGLQARLTKNPSDVDALVELAHHLLRAQMLDEARTLNERALKLAPLHLEALTHAAVLSASTGDTQGAQAGLQAVLTKDPTFAEAWFFRGMLGMQAGNQDLMRESMAQFIRYAPDGPQKKRVRAMLGRSKTP